MRPLSSAAARDRGPGYPSSTLLANVAVTDQNVGLQSFPPRHLRVRASPRVFSRGSAGLARVPVPLPGPVPKADLGDW